MTEPSVCPQRTRWTSGRGSPTWVCWVKWWPTSAQSCWSCWTACSSAGRWLPYRTQVRNKANVCWLLGTASSYARRRAHLKVHKQETNGKKEQIQLLLEADGWRTNTRKLNEWLLLASVTIVIEYLGLIVCNSWICSSFLTDQMTLWLIAALIPDSCLVEVAVLSNLAQVFGLLDSVKKILERRKQQTDPSQEQILSTLASEYRPKTWFHFRSLQTDDSLMSQHTVL